MSSVERQEYLTATVLDQDFLDDAHDNLVNQLEMVAEIETPTGTIYASDRNKYVGGIFYEALTTFPVIRRTVGDWLSAALEFSSLKLTISNADGRFNNFMIGGADYDSFVNRSVVVKMGLRDLSSSYKDIFRGKITEVGGFARDISSFTIFVRNDFDKVNVKFPKSTLETTTYPNLEATMIGTIMPIIYGVWPDSSGGVPAYPLNGALAGVIAGGTNVEVVISENINQVFDPTDDTISKVWYVRGSGDPILISEVRLTNVSTGKNRFEIIQGGGPSGYLFEAGDTYLVTVTGVTTIDGPSYTSNIISIAKDLLIRYGGLLVSDFDVNWSTFRDKSTPTQSAIATFDARLWASEPQPAITVALSLLEQVRVEAFISKDLKIKLLPIHFEEFVASPTFVTRNWDVERKTFFPTLDKRNNFNRSRGIYDYLPALDENKFKTSLFENPASVAQIDGKKIEKSVIFPNLTQVTVVQNQVKEIIKLASSGMEIVELVCTWRSMLLDIGDFISLDVQIGATIFNAVPCLIRSIGYKANGLRVPMTLWSFLNIPFPGHTGTGGGIVGGSTASIIQVPTIFISP